MRIEQIRSELNKVLDELDADDFIRHDPISIPHQYESLQDREVAAFFACTLAWGNRKSIIASTQRIMYLMGGSPYDFILHHSDDDLKPFTSFVHRTFNSTDLLYFIAALRSCYMEHDSLETHFKGAQMQERIFNFRERFMGLPFAPQRTGKHVANPMKNSSAKRLNMFLRWMVRSDDIDLGLWRSIKPNELKCPLDVHVQRAAMHFGLLTRKQQDWKAVEELSDNLLRLDEDDPIRYDLALFKWSEQRSK